MASVGSLAIRKLAQFAAIALLPGVTGIATAADYLRRDQASAAAGTTRPRVETLQAKGTTCTALCGTPVEYTAFDDSTRPMRRIDGHRTALLFTDAMLDEPRFTPTARRRLLDMADFTYVTFTELVGRQPQGVGLSLVALMPVQDAEGVLGRGWIGARGVEIYLRGDETFSQVELATASRGRFDFLHAHEFGHNFDLHWFDAPVATADPPHLFTALMQKELSLYTRWQEAILGYVGDFKSGDRSSEETRTRFGTDFLREFYRQPGADYVACATQSQCLLQTPPQITLSPFFRLAADHDAGFMRRYLRAVHDVVEPGVPGRGGIASLDVHLEALSHAGQHDVSCLAPRLGWTVNATTAARIAALGLPPSPHCADADGDGFASLMDPDDNDAAVSPRAAEIADGKDNEGDGLIDEVPRPVDQVAPVYPLAIDGTAAPGDATMTLALPPLPSTRMTVYVCSTGADVSFATLLSGSRGELAAGSFGGGGASCSRKPVLFPPSSTARPAVLRIEPPPVVPGLPTAPFDYQVRVSAMAPAEIVPTDLLLDRVGGDGGDRVRYAVTSGHAPLPTGARARLWVSGEGFIAEQDAGAGAFALPTRLANRVVAARVQVRVDELPFLAPSELHELATAVAPADFAQARGGTWFDPARGGEGWQLLHARAGDTPVLLVAYYTQARNLEDGVSAPRTPWFVGAAALVPGQDSVDVRLQAATAGRGGFVEAADAYTAADARLSFGADGKVRASVVAGNGELAQSSLSPLLDASTPEAGPINPALAGAWAANGKPGEGVVVNFARDGGQRRVLVAWYTYCGAVHGAPSACGEAPRWVVGSGTYAAGDATVAVELYESSGAWFGHAFRSGDSVTTRVGTASLRWFDCDRLAWHYAGDHGEPIDAELHRVAGRPAGEACDLGPRRALTTKARR